MNKAAKGKKPKVKKKAKVTASKLKKHPAKKAAAVKKVTTKMWSGSFSWILIYN